ncbi:MAG: DUF131 domain-containing protein [Candidatus Nezhaarchaeota archaeon]|nr:DUF131 domain-containing protein [Candidatus Nezhaarchaeota archaeon]
MAKCDLCRLGEASYVCHRCGVRACAKCFDEPLWLCRNCLSITPPLVVSPRPPSKLPALMRIAGALLIAVGVLLFALIPLIAGGELAGGGFVFIGPIPIAFGVGEAWPLILASVALMAIVLITFLAFLRALV